MNSELILWKPLNSSKKDQFDLCMKKVSELEDGDNTSGWVKWKDSENQLVIKSNNFYYKFYIKDPLAGKFSAEICERLGDIYRNDYGIIWNVITIINDGIYNIIEQREEVEVCTQEKYNFPEVLLGYRKVLDKLEEKLGLKEILAQIVDYFPEVKYLKLIRDCANKFPDYGVTKDGGIILLDDADWFLMLLDKDFKQLTPIYNSITVNTPMGEMIFAPQNFGKCNRLSSVNKRIEKWWLFDNTYGEDEGVRVDFRSKRSMMINTNAEVLITGKLTQDQIELITPYSEKPLLINKSNKELDYDR